MQPQPRRPHLQRAAAASSNAAKAAALAASSRHTTASTPLSPSSRWGSSARRVRAGEVRDEGGAPVVQRRGDMAGMAPAAAADVAQRRPHRARLAEHGHLIGGQLPERPPARALGRRLGGRRHPGQRVLDVVPTRAVEPAVQALGDQDVDVTRRLTGRASNRLQPNAATDTHRPCDVPSERNRKGRWPRA